MSTITSHKFNVSDAEKYGVQKAIILEHIRFHQQANEGNPDLTFDGKTFAFIKPSTIKKMYPYLSYDSVRRWLRELESEGVIFSIKPEAKKGNHLKYYHLKEVDKASESPIGQNDQSNGQNDQSKNGQNDQSSIVTNVNIPCGTTFGSENGVPNATTPENWEAAKRVSNHLLDRICEYDPTHRFNTNPPSNKKFYGWIKDIDLAIRRDGRTEEQLIFVIDYLFTHNSPSASFWAKNVESGGGLRRKFDKIKNTIRDERKKDPKAQNRQALADFRKQRGR